MKYPVIADSGANYHMFKDKDFFVDTHPAFGKVLLGDGKTAISIQGIGTLDDHPVTFYDVRYIPDLWESIYSLFLHIQCEVHGLESTYDRGLFITFPSFKTRALIGATDIYLDIKPFLPDSPDLIHQVLEGSIIFPTSTSTNLSVHLNAHCEISDQGKLFPELRRYYNEIKTKCQLNLDVPAGFRHLTSTQRHFTTKTPPRRSSTDQDSTQSSMSHPLNLCSSLSSDDITVVTCNLTSTDSAPIPSSIPTFIPILRSVDKPSSSLPDTISMSKDFIKACVGFRLIETLKKHFFSLYQPTVKTRSNTSRCHFRCRTHCYNEEEAT